MTDDERRGREWCERNGKQPKQGLDSYSYPWFWWPSDFPRPLCLMVKSWHMTEADAYAAVGRAIAEMEAVVGEKDNANQAN